MPTADHGPDLDQEPGEHRYDQDDPITVGGDAGVAAGAEDGRRHLVDAWNRAQMATEAEPNGWFAGPHVDPDRFELLGSGLAGGEGNTWRARYRGELTAPLTVAVKELRRPPRAVDEWPEPSDLRRWNDQRALLQYMRIDHLVTVIDIFVGPAPHLRGTGDAQTPETPYVVMEWVPGPTLADEYSGDPASASSLDDRLAHVQHVAEALHSLHSQSASAGNPTLHRDVKPTNCILDPRRGVVLVDVGTMRRMDDGYDHDGFHTPAYTAPEVLANPRAARAASSDLYSLGALAYFCVVGEDPPVADQPDAARQMEARLLAAARAAKVADVRAFVDHLRQMLEPSADRRPGDARSWSRRLRSLAAVRRRPALLSSGRAAGAVLVAALLGALVAFGAVEWVGNRDSDQSAAPSPGPRTAGAQLPDSTTRPTSGPGSGSGGGGGRQAPPSGPGGPRRPAGFEGPAATDLVRITSPSSGQAVPLCAIITGTSKLPAGKTLLTSVENVTKGDRVRHLQTVRGWRRPAELVSWEGTQFIGLPDDPAGGKYRIEVIVTPLASLQEQIGTSGGERGDWRARLPAESTVAATTFVTRASGNDDPQACGNGPR
jgi:eukaryotic-like serine/threonine-protein kinase